VKILSGDCVEVMRGMPDESVDAIVTDPPYGLGFMGKAWDDLPPGLEWAQECLRVLKPGGHLLAFGGSRTYHRLAVAIEDAGFEIRDQMMWLYGSGFPKSLDVSKAIDKRGGLVACFAEFRDAVREAMKQNKVSRQELQEALGNQMLSHYLTAASQPAVPNLRDYRIIKNTVGLGSEFDEQFKDEAEREVVGRGKSAIANKDEGPRHTVGASKAVEFDLTAPATGQAKEWDGWGTALKPAHEPIVVARKPLVGTVAENVLRFGTGALNVDGCRIGSDGGTAKGSFPKGESNGIYGDGINGACEIRDIGAGRWPANLILDGEAGRLLDEQSGEVAGKTSQRNLSAAKPGMYGVGDGTWKPFTEGFNDTGGASRFFYCAKAGKAERNAGLDAFEINRPDNRTVTGMGTFEEKGVQPQRNHHPTVKPISLMAYLVRLVTPPAGTVLDPFLGSGTTGCAAALEGFDFIGIEREPEYIAIAKARIAWWEKHKGDAQVSDILSAGKSRDEVEDAGQLDLLDEAA